MRFKKSLAALTCASIAFVAGAEGAEAQTGTKGVTMTARGTFEVKVKPLPEDEKVSGVKVARFSIDKTWAGDMAGTSLGEMTATGGPVKGSGGYVAIEEMKVSLKGRSGTFTLMHHATMRNNADFKMLIKVVPDSGTGELEGIDGVLTIVIEGGKHSYVFDYTLKEKP